MESSLVTFQATVRALRGKGSPMGSKARVSGNTWRQMIVAKCPRDGTLLREVETKSSFTKHAICPSCKVIYVLWGDSMTRCMSPMRCCGPSPVYSQEYKAPIETPRDAAQKGKTQ